MYIFISYTYHTLLFDRFFTSSYFLAFYELGLWLTKPPAYGSLVYKTDSQNMSIRIGSIF